ncbi:MAG TPA: hypothetical protein VL326_33260 [Kofleriaceae bacterium]|nr:hypothetical protein [Kofleriaceae bacterium]
MRFGNVARVIAVCAACLAAVGSATSNSNPSPAVQPQNANMSPPPPREMEPARALGLWRSTFGAVKIEADNSRGGIGAGAIQGVWVYQRQGQEVVGYFSGSLRGNVLNFRWQEPNNPPLTGEGYLVFEQTGRQYTGRWWSDKRDRVGDWNGWRQAMASQPAPQYGGQAYGNQNPYMNSQYGGQTYGRPPQPQQPQYPPQNGYPQQQPYPQQYPQQQPTQPYYPQQPAPQQQPQYPQQYPQQQPQQPTQPYYPQQPAPQQPQYPPPR